MSWRQLALEPPRLGPAQTIESGASSSHRRNLSGSPGTDKTPRMFMSRGVESDGIGRK